MPATASTAPRVNDAKTFIDFPSCENFVPKKAPGRCCGLSAFPGIYADAPSAPRGAALLRKQPADILERLEFERVSARVEEKHGRLLSHLALEPHVGLDDELDPGGLQ